MPLVIFSIKHKYNGLSKSTNRICKSFVYVSSNLHVHTLTRGIKQLIQTHLGKRMANSSLVVRPALNLHS